MTLGVPPLGESPLGDAFLAPGGRSTTGPIPESTFQDARISWCYCVRVDVASPVGTKRFTDGGPSGDVVANIDGTGSQTWTRVGLVMGDLSQGDAGVLPVSSVAFWNADEPPTWSGWSASPGLRNAAVQVWIVWFSPDTDAILGQYKAYDGRIDNQQIGSWAELVLKPHHTPWSRESPWLTPPQLGAGDLMPDLSVPFYFGEQLSRSSGR